MTAEFAAHGCQEFGGIAFPLAADQTHQQRQCDYGRRYVQIHGIEGKGTIVTVHLPTGTVQS